MKRVTLAAGMESDDELDIDDIVFPSSELPARKHSEELFVPMSVLKNHLSEVSSQADAKLNISSNNQSVSNGSPGNFRSPRHRSTFANQNTKPRGVSYQRAKSRGFFNQRGGNRSDNHSKYRQNYSHKAQTCSLEHNNSESSEVLDDLRYAITTGNLSTVKEIVSKGIFVDSILKAGWTGLMYACSSGHSDIVSYFLENSADPNYHKDMYTSLMAVCAARKNEEDLLKCCILLLQHGACVNAHERHLTTPLMFAAREGYYEIVKVLLEHGADPNLQDNRGKTALALAASFGHGQVIRLLLTKGSDKNICDNMGQSPEDLAYENGHKELVSLLQKDKAALEASDDESLNVASKAANKVCVNSMLVKKTKNFSKVGELELFLSGIGCSTLFKTFQEHDLNFHDLLIMDEEELEKIGIKQVGVRKKILDACKSVHKKEWENSSLPNLKQSHHISCPDAVAMVANIAKHLKFISSSVIYVRQQIQSQPRILELAQDTANVHDLIDELEDSLKNVHFLNDEMRFLKVHLEKIQDKVQYKSADLIVETIPIETSNRKILFFTLSIATTAAIGIFAGVLWKNPFVLNSIPLSIRLKLPFFK